MDNHYKNLGLILGALAIVFSVQCSAKIEKSKELRKFTTLVNPGCEPVYGMSCSSFTNMTLLYIKSEGKNDCFHFIWSFIGAPTLLMARTSLDSNLSMDWSRMVFDKGDPSIKFNPAPLYSFGWSLVKVWVADDVHDDVQLDKIQSVAGYRSSNFIWTRTNESHANDTHIRFSVVSKQYRYTEDSEVPEDQVRDLGPNGYFKFTIRMQSTTGYSDVLPYMLYSENSTEVDIAFNDVVLNSTEYFNGTFPSHPRLAFKYLLVQNNTYNKSHDSRMRLEKVKTLDDEHTPGVFETYSVRTPIVNETDQSFIQWKPICYTAEVRNVQDSVDVWSYDLKNASSVDGDDNVQDTILWSYYGVKIDTLILKSMNVSFGTRGDKFYGKTKHISWTYSTGFGEPPKDFVSMLVLIIVSIGLGIPAIIITLSILYVIVKRLKRPRDDLLLGQ